MIELETINKTALIEGNISDLEVRVDALRREISNLEALRSIAEAIPETTSATTDVSEVIDEVNVEPEGDISASNNIDDAQDNSLVQTPLFTLEQQIELDSKIAERTRLDTQLGRFEQELFELTIRGGTDSSDNTANPELARLVQRLTLYEGLYSSLLSDYETTRMSTLNNTPNLVQIEEARIPTQPVSPILTLNIALGATIGLMLASGIAFLLEYLDDTIKTSDQLQKTFQLPVLGKAPYEKSLGGTQDSLYIMQHPRSRYAESFRTLRTNLTFSSVDNPLKTVLITSARPGDGKSTVAVNLAYMMAQNGKDVTLVDADLRKPTAHEYFGANNNFGLTNLLSRQMTLDEVLQRDKNNLIKIIASGPIPPNPAELLGSRSMAAVLEQITAMSDIVILDAPPLIVSDPSILAAKADGVLMVGSKWLYDRN